MERVGNVKQKLTDKEIENMAMRAFIEKKIKPDAGYMTVHDFEDWAINVVTRVKDLSEAFRVVWKFGALSEFERKEMSAVHMYNIGFISLPNMQWRINAKFLHYRNCLSVRRKLHT